jgi:hypothetical protein
VISGFGDLQQAAQLGRRIALDCCRPPGRLVGAAGLDDRRGVVDVEWPALFGVFHGGRLDDPLDVTDLGASAAGEGGVGDDQVRRVIGGVGLEPAYEEPAEDQRPASHALVLVTVDPGLQRPGQVGDGVDALDAAPRVVAQPAGARSVPGEDLAAYRAGARADGLQGLDSATDADPGGPGAPVGAPGALGPGRRPPRRLYPDLARSLNNLSVQLAALGRREDALAAVEEAVTICRDLAAARPDAFTPTWPGR